MLEFTDEHRSPFADGLVRRPWEVGPFDGRMKNGSYGESIGCGELSEGGVMKADAIIVAEFGEGVYM